MGGCLTTFGGTLDAGTSKSPCFALSTVVVATNFVVVVAALFLLPLLQLQLPVLLLLCVAVGLLSRCPERQEVSAASLSCAPQLLCSNWGPHFVLDKTSCPQQAEAGLTGLAGGSTAASASAECRFPRLWPAAVLTATTGEGLSPTAAAAAGAETAAAVDKPPERDVNLAESSC